LTPLLVTTACAGAFLVDGAGGDRAGDAAVEESRPLIYVRQDTTPPVATPPACTPAAGTAVPSMVAEIFRCRLGEAGYAPEQVRAVAAEAVVVAECESRFDPAAVVFDGRYRDAAHPVTGDRYTGAGVFQLVRKTADQWLDGGYGRVTDPVANIDAAARIYVSNARRGYPGWSDWACAAANDGFRATSVLPGWPGGPRELPGWAFTY
jgi:hypothetical protein